MNRTYRPFGSAVELYYITAASQLYDAFLSARFSPRKKDRKIEKTTTRSWSNPPQGKQEIARRRRQIERGIIRTSGMVAR